MDLFLFFYYCTHELMLTVTTRLGPSNFVMDEGGIQEVTNLSEYLEAINGSFSVGAQVLPTPWEAMGS